jgi:molybdopterin synthase catalytic subunit
VQIRVLLFASLREAAEASELTLRLGPEARAHDVLDELAQRLPGRLALLERSVLAVNEEYATPDLSLRDGDTVAVIPPVSGGGQDEEM